MQLHQLQRSHKLATSRRVGRGGKKGTYSGRGIKGQKARSGRKMKPVVRELIKRYTKLRGYQFNPKASSLVVVNIGVLEQKFNAGERVSPQTLFEKKIIRKVRGNFPIVKILGEGELTKKLVIADCLVSAATKVKIEKSGSAVLESTK